MAFDFGAWLEKAMAEKGPDGRALYAAETLQDVVALALFSSGDDLKSLPESMTRIVGAFAVRAGLVGDKVGDPKQALDAYFKTHPVPAALVDSLQRELNRDPGKPTFRVGAIRG